MTLPCFIAQHHGVHPSSSFGHSQVFRFQDGGYWYQGHGYRLPPRIRATCVVSRHYRVWHLRDQ